MHNKYVPVPVTCSGSSRNECPPHLVPALYSGPPPIGASPLQYDEENSSPGLLLKEMKVLLSLYPWSIMIRVATNQNGNPIQCITCYTLIFLKKVYFKLNKSLPCIHSQILTKRARHDNPVVVVALVLPYLCPKCSTRRPLFRDRSIVVVQYM